MGSAPLSLPINKLGCNGSLTGYQLQLAFILFSFAFLASVLFASVYVSYFLAESTLP